MRSLRLLDVGFAHPSSRDPRPLFDSLHVSFGPTWTALVGPNGAGKTTLLRLLRGELTPTSGRVDVPDGMRVVLCEQAPESPPSAVRRFGAREDGEARRARARWALRTEALDRWDTLSPGKRKRWQVAAAMDAGADALLLDEPTNHLDVEGRAQLVCMLRGYRGIGVVVAHDRAFLRALADRTVWLEGGRARTFEASVDDARAQREAELEGARRSQTNARREATRLRAEREARRATLARAEASRSARRRMKSARDADGRSVNRKARADAAAASHAKRAARMERRNEAAERARDAARVDVPLGDAFAFTRLPGRTVRLQTGPGGGGPAQLVFERDARIWLEGPNGAGKSTLLRAWGAAWPDEARLVLPQEMPAAARRAARDRLRALPPERRGRTLSCLAALGVSPPRALASALPSPGEARKMMLAEGLSRGVRWLLLDEPTHHLDLPSVERLEAALIAYRGGLVLVTHDRALAAACTRHTWRVRGGVLTDRA